MFGLKGGATFRVWSTVTQDNAGNPSYDFGLSISANLSARVFGITLGGVGFDATFQAQGSGRVKIELSVTVRIKILFVKISKTATFTVGYLEFPKPVYLAGSPSAGRSWDPDAPASPSNPRTLVLNVGGRDVHRNLAVGKQNESYLIEQIGSDADGKTIKVTAMGRTNVYHNVQRIEGDLAAGDDQIQIAESVQVPVVLDMGSGEDLIVYNASAVETELNGGDDGDYIESSSTATTRSTSAAIPRR